MDIDYRCLEANDESGKLVYKKKQHREILPNECLVSIKTCGVCHTDLFMLNNSWGITDYPVCCGHEAAGEIISKGSSVSDKFKIGDRVGISYLAKSCGHCTSCKNNEENYCKEVISLLGGNLGNGIKAAGGFGNYVAVDENFLIRIPEGMPYEVASPLLCAGLTIFSPMYKLKMLEGGPYKVGILGCGALGCLAAQLLRAHGSLPIAFDVRPDLDDLAKKADCIASVRIDQDFKLTCLDSACKYKSVKDLSAELDYVFVFSPVDFPVDTYIDMLIPTGTLIFIALPPKDVKMKFTPAPLVLKGRKIVGSLTGSTLEGEKCLETFKAKNIKLITDVQKLNLMEDCANRANELIDMFEHHKTKGKLVFDYRT